MMFTASDVSSLAKSLSRWEWGEYISEAFVIVACAGELVADLGRKCLTRAQRDRVERLSTILLVGALLASLVCLVRTNELSGSVIGSLGDKAEEADRKAKIAITDSSTALSQAKDALAKAGAAQDSLGKVEDEANRAQAAASNALSLARAAHREAYSVHQEVAKATGQLTQLEAEAQKTKDDLISLAVCNAPRVISNWFLGLGAGAKTYVDSLRPMAGQIVFIEVVPDAEAKRAALELARTLADAQWDVQKPLRLADGLRDGVSVQPSVAFTQSAKGEIPDVSPVWHASNVAEKLLDFLHSYNWQAERGWQINPQGNLIRDEKVLPAGSIRIQVGLYPAVVYVSPPGQKELASRMEESRREREKARAERWLRLPPELPPEVRERMEQTDKEWEAKIKTSKGPCQVLNPL